MKTMWYQPVVKKIIAYGFDHLIVKDNDGLLKSPGLQEELSGYYPQIITYSNEFALRSLLRQDIEKLLIVISGDKYFPTDIANKYPQIEVGFNNIFPLLDPSALDWLNLNEIQELYSLYGQNINHYDKLTSTQTLKFIIRNLYDLDPDISRKDQLIAFLIKYYFMNDELKGIIKTYLQDVIISYKLDYSVLTNKVSFYHWLNQEWRKFFTKNRSAVDFKDLSIRYLLNDCFEQGLMKPIDVMKEDVDTEHVKEEVKTNYWINVGIANLDKVNLKNSFESERLILNDLLNRELKTREWGYAARVWAKLVFLKSTYMMMDPLDNIRDRLDNKFCNYIVEEYDNLAYDQRFYNAPLNNRILSHISTEGPEKFALICFDGMSLKDWPVIKDYLYDKLSVSFKEDFTISMIPTVTGFSRRSIFSGRLPVEDDGVGSEESAFKQFVSRELNFEEEEVLFAREHNPVERDFTGYKAVGLIYNFVDNLSHVAQNQKMLLDNIKDNLSNYSLDRIIERLLHDNYKIYFASDHGNLFVEGNGYNPKKSLVEERAARVVLYETENLANNEEYEEKIILKFPNIIGESYIVTMRDRKKFGNSEAGFTHGGINIEEVIIPFIEVIK